MKSDRLRSYTRRKVHLIRRLRRRDALAASTTRTPAGVFSQATPQLTVRQNPLPQSPTDGERRCSMVHGVLLARAATADRRADASPCAFPPRSAMRAPAAHGALQNGKDGGAAGAMQALTATDFDGRPRKVSEAQDRERAGGNRGGPRRY